MLRKSSSRVTCRYRSRAPGRVGSLDRVLEHPAPTPHVADGTFGKDPSEADEDRVTATIGMLVELSGAADLGSADDPTAGEGAEHGRLAVGQMQRTSVQQHGVLTDQEHRVNVGRCCFACVRDL